MDDKLKETRKCPTCKAPINIITWLHWYFSKIQLKETLITIKIAY
jgi:hypothetical protein